MPACKVLFISPFVEYRKIYHTIIWFIRTQGVHGFMAHCS